MPAVLRYLLAPAVAALIVVTVELARTLVQRVTVLGSTAEQAGFAVAVLALLGPPLFAMGLGTLLGWDVTVRLWRWSQRERPSPGPDRLIAALLYVGGALFVQLLLVRKFAFDNIYTFARPIYLGLGAGLFAAASGTGLAVASGPVIELWARVIAVLRRPLPSWLDPAGLTGAVLWGGLGLFLIQLLGPKILPELHIIDLRGPRLLALWLAILVAVAALAPGRVGPRVGALVGGAVVIGMVGGLAWTFSALPSRHGRRLALDRHTLLPAATLRIWNKLSDGDGDGMSGRLAGADCDDGDPGVRPGRFDVPGDGIDQNCTGADLDLAADPLVPQPARPAPESGPTPWNVVIVTVDALRADAIAEHMPNVAALQADCVRYTRAYVQGATTYWTLSALMTSKMANRLAMEKDTTPADSEWLFGESLRDAGFHTALFPGTTSFFEGGFRQGWSTVEYGPALASNRGERPQAEMMTDAVVKHLEAWRAGHHASKNGRFALWVHYFDPHEPWPMVPSMPAQDDSDAARYAALVRYTDQGIGRLVDHLKSSNLWENTLFVLTGDHGEEFQDHGHRFHGRTLYEEMTRVPLILRVPGATPREISAPIGHVDVVPTLLELLGLATPQGLHGLSRVHEIRTGQAPPERPIWLETLPDSHHPVHLVGVRHQDLKLIYSIDRHLFELYDLAADPKERVNLYDRTPDRGGLREMLMRYVDHQIYFMGQGRTNAWMPIGSPPASERAAAH